MKQRLKNKIVSAVLAYPPETMAEAEAQAEDIYRAVLKALETPTPEMVEAGEDLIPWSRGTESRHGMATPEQIFTAMIRAAQGEDDD